MLMKFLMQSKLSIGFFNWSIDMQKVSKCVHVTIYIENVFPCFSAYQTNEIKNLTFLPQNSLCHGRK